MLIYTKLLLFFITAEVFNCKETFTRHRNSKSYTRRFLIRKHTASINRAARCTSTTVEIDKFFLSKYLFKKIVFFKSTKRFRFFQY